MNYTNYNVNISKEKNLLRTYNNIIMKILHDPNMEKYFLQNLNRDQLQQLKNDKCKQKIFLSIVNTILLSRKDILENGFISTPFNSKKGRKSKKRIKQIAGDGSKNHYGRTSNNPYYGVPGPQGVAARLRSWGSLLREESGVDPYTVYTTNHVRNGRRMRRTGARFEPYPDFERRGNTYARERKESMDRTMDLIVAVAFPTIIIAISYLSSFWDTLFSDE